jgi:hypothetical protein
MTIPPTFLIPETGPMLFADCPFCLAPLPLDQATGSMDCPDCVVHLVLADQPAAVPARVPVATLAPAA